MVIRKILKPDGILFIKVPNGLFNIFKLRVAEITGRLKITIFSILMSMWRIIPMLPSGKCWRSTVFK